MKRLALTVCDRLLLTPVSLFWLGIVIALLTLNGIQLAASRPALAHSPDGLLTALLVLAYGVWFYAVMRRRTGRRVDRHSTLYGPRIYLLLGAGVALTIALVLLHATFSVLIYVDIGLVVFGAERAASIPIIAILAVLFVYALGDLRDRSLVDISGNLLSLASIVAVTYSMAAVLEQRRERDGLIAELREAHEHLRFAAARDVELATLRERNRLARDMHDSLGHALVLIAIKIEAGQRLHAVDPRRAAAEWEDTKALVRSTMGELRRSLAGLRVPALDEQPFRRALSELVMDAGRSPGIDVTVMIPDEADALDRRVQEALYRVTQEALTNVARHARAEHAWVTLELCDHTAMLEIRDDGIGLSAAPRPGNGHYGVTGMRERVEALRGTLTLGPAPERGTILHARVPLGKGADG